MDNIIQISICQNIISISNILGLTEEEKYQVISREIPIFHKHNIPPLLFGFLHGFFASIPWMPDMPLLQIEPVFEAYETYLQEQDEIDFNDMINKASLAIQEGKFKNPYRTRNFS